jgi:hypothetical protein
VFVCKWVGEGSVVARQGSRMVGVVLHLGKAFGSWLQCIEGGSSGLVVGRKCWDKNSMS